ncbi:MAG: hypothetical protein WCI73_08745 [Phycisphaerae bacterium]
MARIAEVILGGGLALILAGCLAAPASMKTGAALREPAAIPGGLTPWPGQEQKTFFVMLQAGGQHITASGFLDAQSPQTFRITALTEMGYVLFDARYAEGTAEIRRILPGLPRTVVANLCRDVALAWSGNLDHGTGKEKPGQFTTFDGHHGHARWEGTGADRRLRAIEIEVGAFDKLTVEYGDYDAQGWPMRVTLRRPMRGYTLMLRFTENQSEPRP